MGAVTSSLQPKLILQFGVDAGMLTCPLGFLYFLKAAAVKTTFLLTYLRALTVKSVHLQSQLWPSTKGVSNLSEQRASLLSLKL